MKYGILTIVKIPNIGAVLQGYDCFLLGTL